MLPPYGSEGRLALRAESQTFYWTRLVVDEFTYLNNFDRIAIQRGLKAAARWVLSGTPPHETFDNVKVWATRS